jgi:hypothetical protein
MHALALAMHVTLLRFFGLRKMFVDILDVDEGPSAVVSIANSGKPGRFGGETSCTV